MTMLTNSEAAKIYAERGLFVMPIPAGHKNPPPAGWQAHYSRSIGNADQCKAWVARHWGSNPRLNLALAIPTGCIVFDVDPPGGHHGAGDGEALLAEYAATHGALPSTWTQRTPSGGRHLLFTLPPQLAHTDLSQATKLDGLDVRIAGKGYIMAAPSRSDGTQGAKGVWIWDLGHTVSQVPPDEAPAEMPLSLWSWYVAKGQARLAAQAEARRAKVSPAPKSPPTVAAATSAARVAAAALENKAARVASAANGSRNNTLFNEAVYFFGLAKAGHIAADRVRDTMLAAAKEAGLDELEASRTLQSAEAKAVPQDPPMTSEDPRPVIAKPRWVAPVEEPPPPEDEPNDPETPESSTSTTGRESNSSTASNGSTSAPQAAAEGRLDDDANALRFVVEHGPDIRFCWSRDCWYAWDGKRWAHGDSEIQERARATARGLYAKASSMAKTHGADAAERWFKFAVASNKVQRINALTTLARSDPRVSVDADAFDADAWAINTPSGIVDLRTGLVAPHARERMHTKITGATFDPTATCPRWESFMDRIFGSNSKLIGYVQRAIGYTLTGLTTEHCLFLCWGTGANGKSTLLETLGELMGDYTRTTGIETILDAGAKQGGAASPELVALRGARFVAITEGVEGGRLAEGRLKSLTGGDTVSARALYGAQEEFRPVFKLWIAANHRPRAKGQDHGLWRRIKLIPFTVTIPEADRDRDLRVKLREEFPGIMAWAARGLAEWLRTGLDEPTDVTAATEEFRRSQDPIAGFWSTSVTTEKSAVTTCKEFYQAYKTWAEGEGEEPVSPKAVGLRLADMGFRSITEGRSKVYRGVRLVGVSGSSTDQPIQPEIPVTFLHTRDKDKSTVIPVESVDRLKPEEWAPEARDPEGADSAPAASAFSDTLPRSPGKGPGETGALPTPVSPRSGASLGALGFRVRLRAGARRHPAWDDGTLHCPSVAWRTLADETGGDPDADELTVPYDRLHELGAAMDDGRGQPLFAVVES